MTFVNGNQNHSVGTVSAFDLKEGVRTKIVIRAEIQKLSDKGRIFKLIDLSFRSHFWVLLTIFNSF